MYNNDFSGVATRYVNISAKKSRAGKKGYLQIRKSEGDSQHKAFELTENLTFNMLCDEDIAILNKAKRIRKI